MARKRIYKHPEAIPTLPTGAIRTLRDVGERLGLPPTTVQSIEVTALRKIRRSLLEDPEIADQLTRIGLSTKPRRGIY